jgi:hypothetical protein
MSLNQEEKDGLENLFQNKFKDWEVPPPPDAWANIKGQINQPKPAFVVWKAIVPMVALLMMAGVGYLYVNQAPAPNTQLGSAPTEQPFLPHAVAPASHSGNRGSEPASTSSAVAYQTPAATPVVLPEMAQASSQASVSKAGSQPSAANPLSPSGADVSTQGASQLSVIAPSTKDPAIIRVKPGTTLPYRKSGKSGSGPNDTPGPGSTKAAATFGLDQPQNTASYHGDVPTTSMSINANPNAQNAQPSISGLRDNSGMTSDQDRAKKAVSGRGVTADKATSLAQNQGKIESLNQDLVPSLREQTATLPFQSSLESMTAINDLRFDAKISADRSNEIALMVESALEVNEPKHNPVIVAGTIGKAESGLSKWAIDAYLMPRFSFRRVEAGLENEMQVRSLENQNRFSGDRIGIEAGARLVRTITKRFELNIGLHFASINEELVYKVDHSTPVGLTQSYNQDGSMLLTPVFASGTVQQKSSFYYGGLNLGTSLYLANTNRIRLSGGLGANWLMRGYTARVHNGAPMADFSFPEANEPFQQINMHLYTGLAYIQPVSDRISVMVEPTLNFFLFSTYAKREPVSVTPTTLGLNLMLRYKL